jgi:uncharacterized protein
MILEGLVTTLGPDGAVNIAPMGPIVNEELTSFTFRPFRTSTTYANLRDRRQGVLHVTDDVMLIAQGAIGEWREAVPMQPARSVNGSVIADACRWYEFEVTALDDSAERTTIDVRVLHVGRGREYFGLNRAKHAVLEGAILATRLHLIPPMEIAAEWRRLTIPIEKTAGKREREAFELLTKFVGQKVPEVLTN